MTKPKPSKKIIKISIIIVSCFIILNLLLSGINLVPSRFKNTPISFLTQNLTWNSRVSNIILKCGLPEEIGKVSDITGERDYHFNFDYDEKNVNLIISNRYFLNAPPHRYYFTIDCKTPEEANKYFDECHKKIMDLYKNESDFKFEGTETETDYEFTDGNAGAYSSTNENGVIKTTIIDDDGNEIPVEEADNVIQVKTKVNSYDMSNTVGVNWWLSYSEGDSSVYLQAEIMY